jgi:hypothetical protein
MINRQRRSIDESLLLREVLAILIIYDIIKAHEKLSTRWFT